MKLGIYHGSLEKRSFHIADNEAALKAMKDAGIKFLKFPEKDVSKAKEVRNVVVDKLKDKLFSSDSLNKLQKSL